MITISLSEKQVATMLKLGTLEVLMGLIQAAEQDAEKVLEGPISIKSIADTVNTKLQEAKADVETVVKAQETPADTKPAKVEKVTETVEKVTETVEKVTETVEKVEKTVDYDTVKASVAEKAAAGLASTLREIFKAHGGTKLSDVPQENLQGLYAEVIAL